MQRSNLIIIKELVEPVQIQSKGFNRIKLVNSGLILSVGSSANYPCSSLLE